MTHHYRHATRAGAFRIARGTGGWCIWFEDECLGCGYASAQHALDDLAGGHCDWPACGDPSLLGLPDEIGDWDMLRT